MELNNKFAIWWLNQGDLESIVDMPGIIDAFPEYLKTQLYSGYGRNGRGRLWVSSKLEGAPQGFDWNDNHPNARALGQAAGFVINMDDAKLCQEYPGIVTEFGMDTLHIV